VGIPLRDINIAVWYTIDAKRITGPTFYAERINYDKCARLILTEFFAQLSEEERWYMWFQQDSANAHSAHDSQAALKGVFDERITSRGLWPARSPDLTPGDIY
jgi:hypothetical protein